MTTHTTRPAAGALQELTAGLLASAPQVLDFAPRMVVRSFLVRGREGNYLINASEGALDSAAAVDALGGGQALWLGHWHEAATGAAAIADRLKTPVQIHAADREEAEKGVAITETFDGDRRIASDLEAISIPGHTPGSAAYLWHGPEARCLFTADSLFVDDGELRGALLDSSDRTSFLASLSRLREVEFDLLVPWVAAKDAAPATAYTPAAFRRDLDTVIARVENGASG